MSLKSSLAAFLPKSIKKEKEKPASKKAAEPVEVIKHKLDGVKEPPKQVGRVVMSPPGDVKSSDKLENEIKKLCKDHRKDDIVEAMLNTMSWEELMMCFANICTSKAIKFRSKGNHSKDDFWLERARRFHDEISTDYLK